MRMTSEQLTNHKPEQKPLEDMMTTLQLRKQSDRQLEHPVGA